MRVRLPQAICTLASAGALVAAGLTSLDTGARRSAGPAAVPIKLGITAGPASTCPTGGRITCLTASAGGRTVTLTVGARVEVDLHSPDSSWSGLSQSGPELLQLGSPRRHEGGVEAFYRAAKPGRTVLRAFERPVCAPARACPQFIRLWQVSIRVHRP